jgi:uncharacterized protein YycO
MTHIGFPIEPDWLRPADIIFTQSNSVVSQTIRLFTQHAGEPPSWASHVAMVHIPPWDMIEAVDAGVKVNPIVTLDGGRAVAMRIPSISDHARSEVVGRALGELGKKYPFEKLLKHAIDRGIFKGRNVARRFGLRPNLYCDALVRMAYRGVYNFPWDIDEGDPDDLMDHMMREEYPIVWASSREALASLEACYPGWEKAKAGG